ncbi:MAG: metal dependent amidohydrolase [Parcubacteria group bacterium Gr01-1014_18]|nr:MAG: metal dependent amidohydrolase [Parcubacteria group bacterium Greene0416_36]TSC81032.1 MAG: metal dependent amidohydrolase [Parcubacteria group bacterium Gr01-1014_18]TSC98954.1 MAG: metal dependent amidohydrolase [Parcubacteria group bacterium Greene1014_20]TSD06754.1 MAG: metal dependent amidohydrolase [Parcubacteria group bacterium Greene0714_2]
MTVWTILGLALFPIQASAESSILITEILLETTENSREEFVELFNPTNDAINLEKWKLVKKTASGSTQNLISAFPNIIIEPRGYLLISSPDFGNSFLADILYSNQSTTLAKNNTIELIDLNSVVADEVRWGELNFAGENPAINPNAGQSLERKKNTDGIFVDTDDSLADFQLQTTPNPQNKNTPVETSTPIIPRDPIDPVEPVSPENPPIPNPPTAPAPQSNSTQSSPTLYPSGSLLISEIVVAPAEGDTEWIELYNNTNTHMRLGNFVVKYSTRTIPLEGILTPRSYFIVPNLKGNLANEKGTISIEQSGILMSQLPYGGDSGILAPKKGQSLARIFEGIDTGSSLNDFSLTDSPTKGTKNNISIKEISRETKSDSEIIGDILNSKEIPAQTETKTQPQRITQIKTESIKISTPLLSADNKINSPDPLTDIAQLSKVKKEILLELLPWLRTQINEQIKNSVPISQTKTTAAAKKRSPPSILISGTVSTLPGEILKRSFFLEPDGYEINLSKGDFPALKRGQVVHIKTSADPANKKIKITNPNQIKVSTKQEELTPELLPIDQITQDLLGKLLAIQGEVLEKKNSKYQIGDTLGEVWVQISTAQAQDKKIKAGDTLQIAGILRNNQAKELFLQLRDAGDLTSWIPNKNPQESIESDNQAISPSSGNKYAQHPALLILSLSINGILIAFQIFKKQQNNKSPLIPL